MYQRCLRVLSALLIMSAFIPAVAQVSSPVTRGGGPLPLRVGAGYSNFESDWTRVGRGGRIGGPAVWIDFDIPKLPPSWSGFQLEVEGRDLNYNRTGNDPTLREYTVAGGVNYAWRYDPAFHPYVKFLTGIGNINFPANDQYYGSGKTSGTFKDSRMFYAPAGGIEVRAHGRLWIRGNYEYQFWPDFLAHHALTPHGLTIGVFYDFSKFALRQYQP
jgi:hypothetical protein